MSKRKNPLLEALKEGRSYTWTAPDGGDLASMREAIKHGQTLTMSPIGNPNEIQVGDRVLVKWHQGVILHIVGEIQGDQFLIVNSSGKVGAFLNFGGLLPPPLPRPQGRGIIGKIEGLRSFHERKPSILP